MEAIDEPLVIEYENQGTGYVKDFHPKDFHRETVNVADFLLKHSHPIFDNIKPVIFGKYKVRMKFSYQGDRLTNSIYIGNRCLLFRLRKNAPIRLNKDVKLIEGTPLRFGGSNNYPAPTFKEKYCILEFVSYGLPVVDRFCQWDVELLSMEKI